MVLLLDEACIGEALGAAEATVCAEAARDPAIRSGLEGVARDEAEHAALAWRSLRWLLSRHPDEATFAERRFDEALMQHRVRLRTASQDEDLSAWGCPSQTVRSAAQRDALDTVVSDVGRRLFASR